MSNLKIEVFDTKDCENGKFKLLLRNSIPYSDSLLFPFQEVVSSLKYIYPNKKLCFTFTII